MNHPFLLTNNSHGDAGAAALDPDYELVAVVQRRGQTFTISERNLETYFVPKHDRELNRAYLRKLGRGIGYKKTAFSYIFQRKA